MSIQTRFVVALGLLLAATAVALSLAVLTFTMPRVAQWESREALEEINRVQRALDRELQHLLIYAREWSVWDDTYRFVLEPSAAYVEENLDVANFSAAQVDVMVYLRGDGQVVWAGFNAGAELELAQGMQLAQEFLPWLPLEALMHPSSPGKAGIVPTGRGLIVVAAYHVVPSREQAPPVGVLVTGRLIDDEFKQRLRAQTDLDLDLAAAADLARLAGSPGEELDLAEDGTPLVRIVSPSRLQLLARVQDYSGRPSLALRIDISRDVFLEGRRIMIYSFLEAGLLFLLTMVIAWFLLRRLVFTPVRELASQAAALHNNDEYARRSLDITRNDEIGDLAREFDSLLKRLTEQADDLRRLSFEDALTGVRNRRFFDEQLRSAWAVLQRTNQPLSLLILDVDDFKGYNDHYGHQQGDEALRVVAEAMRQVLRRAVDTVARYGGEEFAAILPGTSEQDAFELAEKVRQEVLALAIPHAKSLIGPVLSVSIGVASADSRSGVEVRDVLRLADHALYVAKRSGKNTVFVAPEPGRVQAVDKPGAESRAG
ncbi:MAG: diguanylate cyclase [Gammaproteobacteria bacterium]|nr:diguanylate cyclase [Gammaproteobacteria bacterium]